MKKYLYTKYNSTRRPEFTTATSILEEDGQRFILKRPLEACAIPHLEQMKRNYELIQSIYKDIMVLPYSEDDNHGLQFAFVEGDTLTSLLEFDKDKYDNLLNQIRFFLNEVLDVQEENMIPFSMTEQFQSIFPNCKPSEEKAFAIANMDSIFDNFVRCNDSLWCLDYEWVFSFPVPVKYIQYRILLYVYKRNISFFKECDILEEEFIKEFDFSQEQLALYEQMEHCFQEYVHGENVRYIYLENYKRNINTIENLQMAIKLKEQHITNLENQLSQLKHAMKNPLYGMKWMISRVWKKRKHD